MAVSVVGEDLLISVLQLSLPERPVGGELLTRYFNGTGYTVDPTPKFGFIKPLTLLPLTATQLGIAHHQFRHTLGPGHPARLQQ